MTTKSFAAHVNSNQAGSVAWVQGVLTIDTSTKEPRVLFKANVPADLPVGTRIKTAGRVEGIVTRVKPGTANDNQSYRPYPGRKVLRLSTETGQLRGDLEPFWWVFAVEDPLAVCAIVKAHREAQA